MCKLDANAEMGHVVGSIERRERLADQVLAQNGAVRSKDEVGAPQTRASLVQASFSFQHTPMVGVLSNFEMRKIKIF